MYFLLPIGVAFYVLYHTVRSFIPASRLSGEGKYVFITGAGAGFGEGLSQALDKAGWNVIAGCRSERSVGALQSKLSKRAHVFQCDITSDEDVERAAKVVKEKAGGKLHCLVNNAGISGGQAPIDFLPLSEFKHVMNVNLFGQIAIIKALSPYIKNAKAADKQYGRIINVTSIAGIVAPQLFGAYSSSKFAFEAFSDVLRREYMAWNIPVCIVQPGFFGTPMVANSAVHTDRVNKGVSKEVIEQWGEAYTDVSRFDVTAITAEDPKKAIKVLVEAVTSTRPKTRYYPGLQSAYAFHPMSLLPAEMTDMFSGCILGMAKPNRLAPDQPIHWTYYVSDYMGSTAIALFNKYLRGRVTIPERTANINGNSSPHIVNGKK